jgi:alkylation response protein AidB-like acyl-CoA dehydrogenase
MPEISGFPDKKSVGQTRRRSMVSFELSEEQKMVVDTVKKFALKELRPIARVSDESGKIPEALNDKAWGLGLVPNLVPEAYGGYGVGHSAVTGVLVAEEMAYGDLSMAIQILSPALIVVPLLMFGSEAQKEELLPLYCGGKFRPSTAGFLEPRFDFDLSTLQARAVKSGGGYLLSGQKCYVPLAAQAQTLLIYARLGERVEGFLVPQGTTGLSIGDRERNMGINALPTYEVVLDGCWVSAENRLGGEEGGVVEKLLSYHRVACAAMAVGVAKGAFEYARDYAKERMAFGEPIASRQAIAFMLAEMAVEVEATRLLAWEAAWRLDQQKEATREAYLAKMYAADMVLKVTDGAVQTLGGHGYIREHPVELWLRNGRGFYSFETLAIA